MAEQADPIYKILSAADWEAARRAGRFEGSADDRRDGFIHFSDGGQVIGTARKYFAGQADLMLLAVDPTRLADLRWERSRDDALFPHLYGPLDLHAVTRANRLPDDLDAADAIAELLGRLTCFALRASCCYLTRRPGRCSPGGHRPARCSPGGPKATTRNAQRPDRQRPD
jgi:uncharacterized protein (DUF952 family)